MLKIFLTPRRNFDLLPNVHQDEWTSLMLHTATIYISLLILHMTFRKFWWTSFHKKTDSKGIFKSILEYFNVNDRWIDEGLSYQMKPYVQGKSIGAKLQPRKMNLFNNPLLLKKHFKDVHRSLEFSRFLYLWLKTSFHYRATKSWPDS